VSNDIKNLWEQDLVYAAYCEQATTRQQEAFHEMVSRLYARIARIARLEAENLKLQKLLRIARDYTNAEAQVRGELFRTMCELIDEIDAAKDVT
jgi:hypothetical protein